jgi:hypothetical protein
VDFAHLADLSMRAVFWITRAKDNLQCRVVRKFQNGTCGNILRDDLIALTGPAAQHYPVELRRVTALVEVDGRLREMVFLTNHLTWSAPTSADLYRYRWRIETFFKELKQTLQLADSLGHSAKAVKWQVCTALLNVRDKIKILYDSRQDPPYFNAFLVFLSARVEVKWGQTGKPPELGVELAGLPVKNHASSHRKYDEP